MKEDSAARRDWILLPLLSVLTIGLLAGVLECTARRVFPEPKSTLQNCLVEMDPSTGVRAIPHSVCEEEGPESGRVEYRFNGCGHRTGMECGRAHDGAYRIVLIGTSTAFGAMLPREQTLAALLPAALTRKTGRRVEVYNQALTWETPHTLTLRFKDVLAARPDMILWVVAPWDVKNASLVLSDPGDSTAGGVFSRARKLAKDSRAVALLEYLLARNPGWSRRVTPAGGPGFLAADLSPEWRLHLAEFDRYAQEIESRAGAAGVPIAVVFVPERVQAVMLSAGHWPAGYDPYNLGEQLRSIVSRHGGIYLDILPGFRTIPNPDWGYFAVDSHPNANGHALFTGLISDALTGGAAPALRAAGN